MMILVISYVIFNKKILYNDRDITLKNIIQIKLQNFEKE